MIRPAAIALCLLASPLSAQPYSTSMAQCAGIFIAVSNYIQDPAKNQRMVNAGRKWLVSARDQAVAEGQSDPVAHISSSYEATRDEWVKEGVAMVFDQEFRDWMAYCSKFAKDQGIDLES